MKKLIITVVIAVLVLIFLPFENPAIIKVNHLNRYSIRIDIAGGNLINKENDDIKIVFNSADIITTPQENDSSNQIIVQDPNPTPKPSQLQAIVNYKNLYYYYDQLSEKQQNIYNKLEKACKEYRSEVSLKDAKIDDVYTAEAALTYDHPEFFWLESFSYVGTENNVKTLYYSVPKDAKSISAEIEEKAKKVIESIPKEYSEFETIKYIYDWLISNNDYEENEYDQDIRSIFIKHKSVCAGYAKAFLYLCQKADIECAYVEGKTTSSINFLHAWNFVKLEGKFYWLDSTWDEIAYMVTNDGRAEGMMYNYFLVSDKSFFTDHIPNTGYEYTGARKEGIFSYPKMVYSDYYAQYNMFGIFGI